MDAMPRPRWPHLLREVSRHGTVRWVVRVGHGPRIPIEAEYGTAHFKALYHEAINSRVLGEGRPLHRNGEGTLSWLIARYQGSSAWEASEKSTQQQRARLLKSALKDAADMPYTAVTKRHILDGLDRRKATPNQANAWLKAMRRLFAWAVEQEFLAVNPVEGVKNVKRPKSEGFKPWTEDDVDDFERRWGMGTRERLAFAILLHTGLRRGDVARLGRQHIHNAAIKIRTEKTGTEVIIPILPGLESVMRLSVRNTLTFITTEIGKPMTKDSLGQWFSKACRAAGINKSAHGLRKLAATRLANAGVSEAELDAIMGWTPGSGMSRVYTRNRDTARLARQAANKLATSYSQPPSQVGNEGKK